VGEPDFPTPTPILDAANQALEQGLTKYTPTSGTPSLRREITLKLKRDNQLNYEPEQIVVTHGAKQAIVQTIMALAGPDNKVLIPAPFWTSYKEQVVISGASPIPIPCDHSTQFKLSPNVLRTTLSSHPTANLLILCYPSNPTGSTYSRQELAELVQVLEEFPSVYIISDEIYEYIIYDQQEHISIASFPSIYRRTITINGFSKAFCMTGFRLGYLAAPCRELAKAVGKLQGHITSGACSISQHAGLAALRMDRQVVREMVQEFSSRRDYVHGRLSTSRFVVCVLPQGAFYIFPDLSIVLEYSGLSDMEFCMALLDRYRIAVVPGSSFGLSGYIRISYSSSMDVLTQAMDGLLAFIDELMH